MKEYRLNINNGRLYTWEEWFQSMDGLCFDPDFPRYIWENEMRAVDLDGKDLEEVEKKMRFIYGDQPNRGDFSILFDPWADYRSEYNKLQDNDNS